MKAEDLIVTIDVDQAVKELKAIKQEETEHLRATMTGPVLVNAVDPIWLRAFAHYNENHTKRLNVNCRMCYMEVYLFCSSK